MNKKPNDATEKTDQTTAIVKTTPPIEQPASWRINLLRVLVLVAVVLVSLLLINQRAQIQRLAGVGYPGIFISAMISSATVLVPGPGLAVVFTMGGILHPLGVALAAGSGAAVGEVSAYLAGISGRAVIERMDLYRRIKPQILKYGPFAIFVLGVIPNPSFDLAGIAAGALKMTFWKFFLAVWAAQVIKMLFIAFAGSFSLNWLAG
jgi:membrane protein YqaA with SNARE-associated domain